MKNIKICHISTAHPRYDMRIFHKECCSLNEHFGYVSLVVADGLGDEVLNGVNIIDSGKPTGRKERLLHAGKKALIKALETNADVFHIHDPELLRVSKKLRQSGAKVIYDSHEDLPRQVLNKPYIPRVFRKGISLLIEKYENYKVAKLSGVVAATPHIRDRFINKGLYSVDINNYPKSGDIEFSLDWNKRENAICYIGGIFRTRGIFETLEAISGTNIKLLLAGKFSPASLEEECKLHDGWENVEYLGFLGRSEINILLGRVKFGMVILEATPSYIDSLPVKMFEYMASGLPVIASNFPLWRQIITESNCGICVDQTNPIDVKEKISALITENNKLEEMGRNGREAIEKTYNWENEEEKLIKFYKSVI